MSQATYGFDDDCALFRESARKFLGANADLAALRQATALDPEPMRMPTAWPSDDAFRAGAELGFVAAAVPEAQGGLQLPRAALAALAEELGRHAFPSAIESTLMVAFLARRVADSEAGGALLGHLAEGARATLAVCDAYGEWEHTASVTHTVSGSGALTLTGSTHFVQDAGKAEWLVVRSTGPDGTALVVLPRDAAGVTHRRDGIVDLTREQGTVQLEGVVAEASAVLPGGDALLASAMPDAWLLLAADMVGTSEWLLQTTVEYAKVRTQFDRAIGSYQGVKHPLVNAMMSVDRAKSLVYAAAEALDEDRDDARLLAHMAKAAATEAADFTSSRAVQLHGGIGFTWESDVHFFFKRNKHSELLFGDAAYHKARVADLLIDG
ncbi:MAG: acyl-CoA dehydrogenase [Polyangiales bacterium]|nr:acyl-CoA dehydrogenase [Myxococcales bacterium]